MNVDMKTLQDLTMLALSPEECAQLQDELEAKLVGMAELAALDLQDAPLCVTPLEHTNVLRDDIVLEHTAREALLQHAPAHNGEYYAAPAIQE
ncbi:MAG: Asp-tRNA(Asn)/Glu-tRNA(Gln) amidotransferase subunit GatC [Oscillospiraceae bacterium]|nr:Asp-tRNA(Asn)/Glu-tRNA(Gln) amidotransferase subunit GatC [Oscillospiraceae bacterium]